MSERRTELRMVANKKVSVVLVDGSLACLGTVLDLSLAGARIHVALPIEIGRKIDLIFDGHEERFRSTVMWSTDTEIGISFDLLVPRVAPSTAA